MGRTGILTERFDVAVAYALEAHDTQRRKGTEIPYAAHLLGVASLVLEAGGSEDDAIAAVLHDVVEDQGGARRLADVRKTFGDRVAAVVGECSAEDKTDDPGWRVRKERYIAGLSGCSTSALLVSAADKLYNARAILDDYRASGSALWDRFNADAPKGASILWYYDSLVAAYRARPDSPARSIAELGRTVRQLARLMTRPPCPNCGAGDVGMIVWGMPMEGEIEKAEDDVAFGGCVIDPFSPDFWCQVCDHAWLDPDRPPWS